MCTHLFFHSFCHQASDSRRQKPPTDLPISLFCHSNPYEGSGGSRRIILITSYPAHNCLVPYLVFKNIFRILTRAQKCLYHVAQPTFSSPFQVLLLHSPLGTQGFSHTSYTSLPWSRCALGWNDLFALSSWTWPHSNCTSLSYYLLLVLWEELLSLS